MFLGNIGEIIKYYRIKKNLSIDTLSSICGISTVSLSKYENGHNEPKPEQILKIAEALDISPNLLNQPSVKEKKDIIPLLYDIFDNIDVDITPSKKSQKITLDIKDKDIYESIISYIDSRKEYEEFKNSSGSISQKIYDTAQQSFISEITKHDLDYFS